MTADELASLRVGDTVLGSLSGLVFEIASRNSETSLLMNIRGYYGNPPPPLPRLLDRTNCAYYERVTIPNVVVPKQTFFQQLLTEVRFNAEYKERTVTIHGTIAIDYQ